MWIRCLKARPKNVKKVETELEKVKSYLNKGEKVAISLAPTCFGVFDVSAQKICGALKKLGCFYVEETAVGALDVTMLIKRFKRKWKRLVILQVAALQLTY